MLIFCPFRILISFNNNVDIVAVESDHRGRNRATQRKGDTPLGYSGRIALRREQCDLFTPYKNCNIETRSRDYAKVDEAVFSPCRAEDSRPEPRRAET
jgi:hypothetical protein